LVSLPENQGSGNRKKEGGTRPGRRRKEHRREENHDVPIQAYKNVAYSIFTLSRYF
jgi:hypothetical protein